MQNTLEIVIGILIITIELILQCMMGCLMRKVNVVSAVLKKLYLYVYKRHKFYSLC